MKVTNAKESNTDFKPIEVNIIIENVEEYNAMLEMSLTNVRIPELFDVEYRYLIKEFLEKMCKIIINK